MERRVDMQNLLLGNGIDIQFGGIAYTSSFIIKRIRYKALMGKYAELFNYQISAKEIVKLMEDFVVETNKIIHNEYDDYAIDIDTKEALQDFKCRYTEAVLKPEDIMLEDWLFVVHMFFLKNIDLEEHRQAAIQGFERLLLDAIYNDGLLQEIHTKMPKSVRRFLQKYDTIFTLNYDNNVEKVTSIPVYHLHGDFSVLADSENENITMGCIRRYNEEMVYQENMRHCFCNALLNYSGRLKKKRMDDCYSANKALEQLVQECIDDESKLLSLKNTQVNVYQQVIAKMEKPELKAASDYHYSDLCSISGELHILGMSPNNDAHIFDAILNNDCLTKVVFYYRDEKHREYIEQHFSKNLFECKNVNQLWRTLRCENRVLNCTYSFPQNINDLVETLNTLSMDKITTEQVKESLKQVTRSEMLRLCKLVKDDIKKKNPGHVLIKENKLVQQMASISYIGLQQGVLPTVLYLICVMNYEYIKD